jgi:hypothetical protein
MKMRINLMLKKLDLIEEKVSKYIKRPEINKGSVKRRKLRTN